MPQTLTVTQEASTPQEIASLSIVKTGRKPQEIIPERIYLTATDPSIPEEPTKRLMVSLQDGDSGYDLLLDLTTNNDRFSFVCKVVRESFNRFVTIYESFEPIDGSPF